MRVSLDLLRSSTSKDYAIAEPLIDVDWYLSAYPDVHTAGVSALQHYMSTGWAEGRLPNALFDTDWYLAGNPDVELAGVNPLIHYAVTGWREGRLPHPLFDTRYYLQNNPDVAAADINPLAHYLVHGWKERRNPHPLFSTDVYLSTYPDVAASGLEPLTHFIRAGSAERRQASPEFHTDWYARQYPEAVASGMNLLRYYVEFGAKAGHHPTAIAEIEIPPKTVSRPAAQPSAAAPAKPAAPKPARPAPTIAKDAGALLVPPRDAAGQLTYPVLRRGDGRRMAAMRLNQDHKWLEGKFLEDFLNGLTDEPLLPAGIRRILVIGHDFTQKTGVMRSLSHYLSALTAAGGVEITSLQLAPGADALVAWHEVEVHDLIIINSLPLFFEHENGIELLRRCGPAKAAIYLHETDFVFNRLETDLPAEYAAFAAAAGEFNFLTVSAQQEDMLRRRFGAGRLFRVAETSPIDPPQTPAPTRKLDPSQPLRIVMAGTLQPRKGVNLFSGVADKAAAEGLPWKFLWAGGEVGRSEGLYRSENVDFVGNLDGAGMLQFLADADVFLLSSEDDPFPLACLEALQMQKRVVVYKDTGTSEILRSVSGCAVYETHTPEAAFAALKRAISREVYPQEYDDLNAQYSLDGFVRRFREAVAGFHRPAETAPDWAPSPPQRIAAIVHLYYHDLWHEIAAHLENLRHRQPDLYVTLSSDKPREELDRMRAAILHRWPDATVLECENRGMDVGPFVEVARHIASSGRAYDLIVKLHSKKSLSVSGAEHGEEWRKKLLGRIIGSVSDVDRIVSIFQSHPDIGMIGQKGMLKELTSADQAAGRIINAPKMNLLADRLRLSDRTQNFFVGSMFWARAEDVLQPIGSSGLSITDFESEHVPDGSLAHAFERVFACMVRSNGRRLMEHDPDLPKPVHLLKNRHEGSDIYVIAAGASAGLIDPEFFRGKITIGVNRVFVKFPCTYAIFKEYGSAEYEQELLASGAIPITAQWDSGNIRQGKIRRNTLLFRRPEYYFYEHLENTREIVDLSVIRPGSDKLVVSYSTITSAMHLAAYMGARNVILVGHDCGLLDGKTTFDGYYKDMSVSPWASASEYADWLGMIENQTLQVREAIHDHLGARTVSLNPFVNLGLEGHQYSRKPIKSDEAGSMPGANRKPVLLLCNGPSAKDMRAPENLDDYVIARMNFFFLEEKPFADGRVDHLFWALNEPTFHSELESVLHAKKYQVGRFNCPVPFEVLKYPDSPVSKRPFFKKEELVDHWKLIAKIPSLARIQMTRPLPTQGVQALAALAVLGHREFAIAGLDFYAKSPDRYFYDVPERIASKLEEKHLQPGYEKDTHSIDADLGFLRHVIAEFPDLRFRLLSDMPIFQKFLMTHSIPYSVETAKK